MHLLYASDLHGSSIHFSTLLALAVRLKPDALLLGGDLFQNSDPIAAAPVSQRRDAETFFADWCRAAPCPVYWIAGNHEWRTVVDPPPAAGTYVHGKCVPLGDWDLIGFTLTSPTPYWLIDHERREAKHEHREERGRCWSSQGTTAVPTEARAWLATHPTLLDELRTLPEPRAWRRTILMAHDPPFDSGLDLRWGNQPVGSYDVRHFLLAKQPAVSLHGHIHEAPLLTGKPLHIVGATHGFNAGRVRQGCRALWLDPDKPAEYRLFEGDPRP
ncbi:MAG: metallophosphoesterase [Planctomycetes bacterium]|nr:metallophosphoesterase [Planctomycetota bacterium]